MKLIWTVIIAIMVLAAFPAAAQVSISGPATTYLVYHVPAHIITDDAQEQLDAEHHQKLVTTAKAIMARKKDMLAESAKLQELLSRLDNGEDVDYSPPLSSCVTLGSSATVNWR